MLRCLQWEILVADGNAWPETRARGPGAADRAGMMAGEG